MLGHFLHWLAVHTGTVNEAGPYYGFWSGFGSDIQEFAIFGVVFGAFRKHNCESPWCLRIGRHPTADGLHHLCHHHHPELGHRRSLAEIHDAHRAAA